MMNIGITFGCFIPLHEGHRQMINRAIKENDRTIIAVCGFDDDRGKDFVPFRDRITLMKWIYEDIYDINHIKVVAVDDKKIGLTGLFDTPSWDIWCKELFANANIDPNDESNIINWYTGEDSYIEKIKGLYPNHNFVKLNRKKLPISGTLIRSNPKEYEKYIHPIFMNYLNSHKIT